MKGSFVMLTADYIEKIAKFNVQWGVDPNYPGFGREQTVDSPAVPHKHLKRKRTNRKPSPKK